MTMLGPNLVMYEEEFQRITSVLARLWVDANAKFVFLVDKNGQQIAAKGDLEKVDATSLASLTAGNVAATDGLARLIGEKEFSILFHEGEKDNIHISIVAQRRLRLGLLADVFEELRQLTAGLLDAEPDEAEGASLVEYDDEDHSVPDERHVEIVALALVKVGRELFFTEDLGEATGRRDAAGGQTREARAVDSAKLARLTDQLPGLVDDEDALGVCVSDEPLDDPEDAIEVVLLHHELGLHHRHPPL